MKVPKVIFVYSDVYDEQLLQIHKDNNQKVLDLTEIEDYIKSIKEIWDKESPKILLEIGKVLKLEWQEESVKCYLVSWAIPFSDPLTIPVYKEHADYFIDVLIHELIHNLLIQNSEKLKNSWLYIDNEYSEETINTRIHVIVQAVQIHLYKQFFGEGGLKRDKKLLSHLEDYRRAWEIVEKEGYDKILLEFQKHY